jgi:LysM repeat protein
MSQTYTVIQGDHISRIAEKFGFGNSKPIWGDHKKSDLKEQRDNPYVLKPGDQI